jgi:hypothetical protein
MKGGPNNGEIRQMLGRGLRVTSTERQGLPPDDHDAAHTFVYEIQIRH